jgi:hypothetical protein
MTTHSQTYEKYHEYYLKNKENILSKNKEYRLKHKSELKQTAKKKYLDNKEEILVKNKKWAKNNKEYFSMKWKTDSNWRLRSNISNRLRSALRVNNVKKSNKTLELISCSISDLKKHLENQFKDNMTWENYGKWHIDHIIPISHFNLNNLNEQKKCFHYSNLQPLWAYDNLSKSSNIIRVEI